MALFKKLLKDTAQARHVNREAELYRSLMRREAKIGGEVFGPVPRGGRREFFCLDEHTWIWHEEWIDQKGKYRIRTTRYDVRPTGILKAQDGINYQRVSLGEAERLLAAAETYERRMNTELYAAYLAA